MTSIDCALTNQALHNYDEGEEVGGLAFILDIVSLGPHYEEVPAILYSQSYIKATPGVIDRHFTALYSLHHNGHNKQGGPLW